MHWINGQPRRQLPVGDRATQFGDGFFTTARIRAGQIDLLPYHLDRLAEAGERLLFPPLDRRVLAQEMRQVAELRRQGVLKVIVSRGSGGRGYSAAGCDAPLRIISHTAAPAHYAAWRESGVSLALSPVRLARSPLLAGIKHLNRLEQVLIRAHLDRDANAAEALVLDTEGHVVECCAANIFWRAGNAVYTPALAQAGVAGVMRRHIMQLLASSPFSLELVEAPPADLDTADEVIICNALMPVLPVNHIGQRRYHARTLFECVSPNC
ncbi:aminodeoxychorismate lyase [Acerihabitans arboris]|uniref:Aminodeoxychorismate lyase n=1 Tax=Acerihabitans arboris TaxID=2691583 RepID=A0A845SKT4_9GAMM|nr:aminodeoxychorismate lyase [Acerihabitans arboris]NDL61915.1 aminodeoxychorismate lyase [Acerihabitans arboris]